MSRAEEMQSLREKIDHLHEENRQANRGRSAAIREQGEAFSRERAEEEAHRQAEAAQDSRGRERESRSRASCVKELEEAAGKERRGGEAERVKKARKDTRLRSDEGRQRRHEVGKRLAGSQAQLKAGEAQRRSSMSKLKHELRSQAHARERAIGDLLGDCRARLEELRQDGEAAARAWAGAGAAHMHSGHAPKSRSSGNVSERASEPRERILRALRKHPGLKYRELSEKADVSWHDLSGLLKELVAGGNVEKSDDGSHHLVESLAGSGASH